MNIFCNNFDAKASRIIANLIPRDLYQSSEAPAAGSEDKTNCAEEFSKKHDITARRIKQEETHMAIIIWNMCLKVKIHWTWLKISAPVEYEINHPGIVLN